LLLIGHLVAVPRADGWLLLLVKPQFEVGRELLGRDGVVRTPAHQRQAIANVIKSAGEYGWHCVAAVPSRLPGASGNREFFVLLRRTESVPDLELAAVVNTWAVAGDQGLSRKGRPADDRPALTYRPLRRSAD